MCSWTVCDHLQTKCKHSHSTALCSLSESETKCQTSKFFCKILNREQLQIVLLRSDNRWRGCGAVLLSCNPAVIVTAAHCLEGVEDPAKLRVNVTLTPPMWRDPVIKELPLIWFIIDFIYLIANFDMIVHDDDRLVVEEQISRCPSPQLRTWERRAFRFLRQNKRLGTSAGLIVNLDKANSEYHVWPVWFSMAGILKF